MQESLDTTVIPNEIYIYPPESVMHLQIHQIQIMHHKKPQTPGKRL